LRRSIHAGSLQAGPQAAHESRQTHREATGQDAPTRTATSSAARATGWSATLLTT
jgi:hypothetical protein